MPAEAAPARNRVRILALSIFALLLLLAGRAVQLAFSGDPLAEPRRHAGVASIPRADIVDRQGVLLATTVRAYALTAEPRRVWNAAETADALRTQFPDLDRAKAFLVQKRIHRLRMRNLRQGPGDHHPVEAAQHARNLLGVPLHKSDTRFHADYLHPFQAHGTGSAGLGA